VAAITGPAIGRVGIAHQINFFMVVTYWRRPLLTHAESRRILRSIIAQVRRAYPFQIEVWVYCRSTSVVYGPYRPEMRIFSSVGD
jgi:hypothetical protein